MGRKSIGATGAVEHRGQIPSVVLTIRSGDWQVEHLSPSGVMSMQEPFR